MKTAIEIEDADSSSEDDDLPMKYDKRNVDKFFDSHQLMLMQLDDETYHRDYLKVTCQRTIKKEDQDFFKVSITDAKLPNKDTEF